MPVPAPISAEVVEQVRRVQQGCDDAAAFVCRACSDPLLHVIRRILHQPLARLFDAEDFLILVLTTICLGHFPERALNSPEALWHYIRAIACHEVHRAQDKYLHGERHLLTKDVPLTKVAEEALAREEPPEELAELHELLEHPERLLNKLPPWKRPLAELALLGYTVAEIVQALEVTEAQVCAVRRWLREEVRKER